MDIVNNIAISIAVQELRTNKTLVVASSIPKVHLEVVECYVLISVISSKQWS